VGRDRIGQARRLVSFLAGVYNGNEYPFDLSGNDLKAALDDAGIQWRVVIISACHAGAFIPYVSNERDITDFGAAFIRDAWPMHHL